jgi:hypothetical protein
MSAIGRRSNSSRATDYDETQAFASRRDEGKATAQSIPLEDRDFPVHEV